METEEKVCLNLVMRPWSLVGPSATDRETNSETSATWSLRLFDQFLSAIVGT
jgi:hypothetical protein